LHFNWKQRFQNPSS